MAARLSYVFDYRILNYGLIELLKSLVSSGHRCFVLAESTVYSEEIIGTVGKDIHYFISPNDEKVTPIKARAWCANTVRSLNPSLYLGADGELVEQVRLLGVPSALYRL